MTRDDGSEDVLGELTRTNSLERTRRMWYSLRDSFGPNIGNPVERLAG